MDNVTSISKKIESRKSAARILRLLGIVDRQAQDVLDNPKFYLDQAHEQITKLKEKLHRVECAAKRKVSVFHDCGHHDFGHFKTIVVTAEDYECLVAVRAIFNPQPKEE